MAADRRISQLVSATTPLSGNEQVPVVQGGVTLRTTAQDIADLYVQTTPTLQEVTDTGNTTTNDVQIQGQSLFGNQGINLYAGTGLTPGTTARIHIYEDVLGDSQTTTTLGTEYSSSGYTLSIGRPILGSSYTLTYPTTGGFFAVSVNGVTASSAGNVEIGIGGGEDTQVVFGSGSVFSGSNNLTYDYTNNSLKLTGSFNLTGSSNVVGSVIVTGSLSLTGSSNVVGSVIVTGSFNLTGSSNVVGSVIVTGSLQVTGSTATNELLIRKNNTVSSSIKSTTLTTNRTHELPDQSGTLVAATTLTDWNIPATAFTAIGGAYTFVTGSLRWQKLNNIVYITSNVAVTKATAGLGGFYINLDSGSLPTPLPQYSTLIESLAVVTVSSEGPINITSWGPGQYQIINASPLYSNSIRYSDLAILPGSSGTFTFNGMLTYTTNI